MKKYIHRRLYKTFDLNNFKNTLKFEKKNEKVKVMVNLKLFLKELTTHVPLKKKFLWHNNTSLTAKDLRKQTMVRTIQTQKHL